MPGTSSIGSGGVSRRRHWEGLLGDVVCRGGPWRCLATCDCVCALVLPLVVGMLLLMVLGVQAVGAVG